MKRIERFSLKEIIAVVVSVIAMCCVIGTVCAAAEIPSNEIKDVPEVIIAEDRVILRNSKIIREIAVRGTRARTLRIINRIAQKEFPSLAEEFEITLADGTLLPSTKFTYKGAKSSYDKNGKCTVIVSYEHPEAGIEAQAVFTLAPGDNVMRKKILLRSMGKKTVSIDSLTVD